MEYITLILNVAKSMKVSGPLLLAICSHESNLKNIIVPHDGGSPTYGICQVKDGTAEMMGNKGANLMNAEVNALIAAKYLAFQQERYGDDWCKIVSAYNLGTYMESKKIPGMPRNIKYVRFVQEKLDEELQDRLSCVTEVVKE